MSEVFETKKKYTRKDKGAVLAFRVLKDPTPEWFSKLLLEAKVRLEIGRQVSINLESYTPNTRLCADFDHISCKAGDMILRDGDGLLLAMPYEDFVKKYDELEESDGWNPFAPAKAGE